MKLQFNEQIAILPFDGLGVGLSQYCEIPTAGQTVSRVLIPTHLLQWLQSFDGSKETGELIADYVKAHPNGQSADRVENFVSEYCVERGLLRETLAPPSHLPAPKAGARYVRLRTKLIPARIVSILALPLRPLFQWKVFLALVPVFAYCHIFFYTHVWPSYQAKLGHLSGTEGLAVMGYVALLGIMHELGHAAALARYGYNNSSIGWGVYVIWGVLWTDLSDAWRLSRWRRAMVDVGGIYLHLTSLCVLPWLVLHFDSPVLACVFFIVDWQILASLNPMLRTDAFWLASDVFGIPNLRDQSLGLIERMAIRFFPNLKQKHRIFPLSEGANAFLLAYTIIIFFFSLALSVLAMRNILTYGIPSYPGLVVEFLRAMRGLPHGVVRALEALLTLLARTLVLYGFVLTLWGLSKRLLRVFGADQGSTSEVQRGIPPAAKAEL